MDKNILATVNGNEITTADLYELVQNMGQSAAQFQSAEGQKQLVDELITQELLYLDALKNGLNEEEEFKLALEHATKALLKQYAVTKLLRSVEAKDAEVKEYFDTHKQLFNTPEKASARHILVQTEEEALRIADEIKAGLAFNEAAEKYSSCPSKAQGGHLGTFARGQMVPEFENAVFSMKPGEISAPVKTQFGYHLIELETLMPAQEAEFEKVKDQVKDQFLLAKRQGIYLEKRYELEKIYPVEVKHAE